MNHLKYLFLLFVLQILYLSAKGQKVKGLITDSLRHPISFVNIKITSPTDTLKVVSKEDGTFSINKITSSNILMSFSHLGYKKVRFHVKLDGSQTQTLAVIMEIDPIQLRDVKITSSLPVIRKKDTIQYNAVFFGVKDGEMAQNLIKRLPGLTVNEEGKLFFQNNEIAQVKVNGKDFFSGDVPFTIQNLPASILQNLQIIDKPSDDIRTGNIKTGNTEKILNLNLKKNINKGVFGNASLGAGTNERLVSSVIANMFNDKQQVSVRGKVSNVNFDPTSNNLNELPQISSSPFDDGVPKKDAIGIQLRNNFSEKIKGFGRYNFLNENRNVVRTMIYQQMFQNGKNSNKSEEKDENGEKSNSLSYELEYDDHISNTINIRSTLLFKKLQMNSTSEYKILNYLGSSEETNYEGSFFQEQDNETLTSDHNISYRHQFRKKRRTFSATVDLGTNNSNNNNNDKNNSLSLKTNTESLSRLFITDKNTSNTYNLTFVYTEPIDTLSSFQLFYKKSVNNTKNDHQVANLDTILNKTPIDSLNNNYKNYFGIQQLGVTYENKSHNIDFNGGLALQQTLQKGSVLGIKLNKYVSYKLLPSTTLRFHLTKTKSINLSYRKNIRSPSISQLQPIVDISNPQYPIHGNADLKPESTHSLTFTYSYFNVKTGKSLAANLSANKIQNSIVTNAVVPIFQDSINHVVQETFYLNTNGNYSLNASYTYSVPFQRAGNMIFLNGNSIYNKNVNFINSIKNYSNYISLSQGVGFRALLSPSLKSEAT